MNTEIENRLRKTAKITGIVLAVCFYAYVIGVIIYLINIVAPVLAVILTIGAFVAHLTYLGLWLDDFIFGERKKIVDKYRK